MWASEIRHYNLSIERRLDKHGLLDPPEERDGEEYADGTRVYKSDDYTIIERPVEDD